MKIISREGWNARRPASTVYRITWAQRTEFYVHHTAGPRGQSIRSIQDFHIDDNGWSDVGYNFLVDEDGVIYEGRGWLAVGAHCPNHNRSGISAAFIGKNNPTPAALRSIRWLYEESCRRAGRKLLRRGHGQSFPTSCPGPRLQSWLNAGMPIDDEPAPKPAPPIKIIMKGGVPQWPGRLLMVDEPMMFGEDIRLWQERLKTRGWNIDVDSWYGPESRTVCRGYQRATGLPENGRVDKATWDMTWSWRPPQTSPEASADR
ncbi:hypothetical protein Aple_010850 [Acrocarpospora pleiomorpha]|uniref:N-acetylmuramoyl-L-alanine amidase n=1 Tax=Acrocarpospora pleiomorpha TaxID=90975 RepID=A0A5M3XAM4_9ACTN|nr:peptidoglycan-binding domain-containing protein [Acrocarpospora pleiomorpha]GES18190.1 hypothetical protein Aple_010850 [Acrocarpospora pleiomorpha]